MKKAISKTTSVLLALSMLFTLALSASAAEITVSGGSGTTPVTLVTTQDGTLTGTPTPTAMSVTVPTALPLAMAPNGDVTTASDCNIVNHSYGAVRVKSITVTAADGWSLTAYGDKTLLSGAKVDSNLLGFGISLGGGAMVSTTGEDAHTQTLLPAPIAGCTMTGAGNSAGCMLSVSYAAILTPLSTAATGQTVASVVFVVEWDT